MDFPDVDPTRTGEVETRPQRAETQPGRRDLKKRMLGVAPSIFCKVNVPKTEKWSLATPQIFIYVVARDEREQKRYHFFERYKIRRESEKDKNIHKESVSEQTNKKHDESRQQLFR